MPDRLYSIANSMNYQGWPIATVGTECSGAGEPTGAAGRAVWLAG